LEQRGQAALVQWRDALGPHRVILPNAQIKDNAVAPEQLEYGIPYGVPWETVLIMTVTPHVLARLLRERGIWTEVDLQKHLSSVRQAFAEAYAMDLKNLIDSVRQAREGGNE
jgi:hypothetical protein